MRDKQEKMLKGSCASQFQPLSHRLISHENIWVKCILETFFTQEVSVKTGAFEKNFLLTNSPVQGADCISLCNFFKAERKKT